MLTNILFPPGQYYIGDPCYVIQEWDEFCDTYFTTGGGELTFHGQSIFVDNTTYGDGTYEGTDGHSYSVDAGLLGIIPTSLITEYDINNSDDVKQINRLGRLVTFDSPIKVDCDQGDFRFGHIFISTK